VDLALVAVPAPAVPEVVAACGRKGVGGLIVISAGFAELDGGGAEAERRVARLAHINGMRLIGPNCFGVVNTDRAVSLNATFAADAPLPGRVGFASQSGGLGIAILAEARHRGLGLSTFVSMGNKADVSGNDLLTWWEQDDATDVILLYLESFGNPRKFSRIARRVGRAKPIVAVKGGRSPSGSRAASSHTAALASSDEAVDALFRQTGVVRVDTIEELFDAGDVLAHQPIPVGSRVGIVTNAGGPGVLAADACAARRLEIPELSTGLQQALHGVAPHATVRNPVDLIASATADTFGRAVDLILASAEVDALVVIFTPPVGTRPTEVADAVIASADRAGGEGRAVPIVASFTGAPEAVRHLRSATPPVPCFAYPETAVRALGHAVEYGLWRARPMAPTPDLASIDPNTARRRLGSADPGSWVTGAAAVDVMAAYGIPAVPTLEVPDGREAARAAEAVGLPVALKAVGPVHKTEAGGVRLGLTTADAVRVAFDEMHDALGDAMTTGIVQPLVEDGVETIVGFVSDRTFGPQVLFGLGGTAVELLGDHTSRLAPLTEADATEMVLGLRATPLLTGFRGSPALDTTALVDILLRVSRLAEDLPEIVEADLNPVIVSAEGATVVDVRLRLGTARDRADMVDARHLR
jgi:acyl-CoA synthetase (NDP forming)